MGMIGNAPVAGIIQGSNVQDGSITNADLAAGVAVANLGYTPVNKAGDVMTGGIRTMSAPGAIAGTPFANVLRGDSLAYSSRVAGFLAGNDIETASTWYGSSSATPYVAIDGGPTGLGIWTNQTGVGTWFNGFVMNRSSDSIECGTVTFPKNPAFNVRASNAYQDNTIGWSKVLYNDTGWLQQRGNSYNASLSRFTAPATGWYQFNAQISYNDSADIDGTFSLAINGDVNSNRGSVSMSNTGNYDGHSLSAVILLQKNEYVEVYRYSTVGTRYRDAAWQGSFSGIMIG